jgi:hypothetical protein
MVLEMVRGGVSHGVGDHDAPAKVLDMHTCVLGARMLEIPI